MELKQAIAILDQKVPDPHQGLPDEVFYYISRTTPLINVDLLIKDEKGRTLLAWRNDQYCGQGWHVPGGIIRYKETMRYRLDKVAALEIGAPVKFEPAPLAINEIILKQKNRGHFISILYRGFLPSSFVPANKGLKKSDAGYLAWHDSCPDDILKTHEIYRQYIDQK